jgi:hypothetical protein
MAKKHKKKRLPLVLIEFGRLGILFRAAIQVVTFLSKFLRGGY